MDYCTFNQVLTLTTIVDPVIFIVFVVAVFCLNETINVLEHGLQLWIWNFFFFFFLLDMKIHQGQCTFRS